MAGHSFGGTHSWNSTFITWLITHPHSTERMPIWQPLSRGSLVIGSGCVVLGWFGGWLSVLAGGFFLYSIIIKWNSWAPHSGGCVFGIYTVWQGSAQDKTKHRFHTPLSFICKRVLEEYLHLRTGDGVCRNQCIFIPVRLKSRAGAMHRRWVLEVSEEYF
jgi:hypothetical protein